MNSLRNLPYKLCYVSLIILLSAALATAQQARGTLRGLITDELGAAIVGANVTLTDASGAQKKTTTSGEGVYNFAGLTPGKYTLQAAAPGFAPSENKEVDVTTARQTLDLTLSLTLDYKVTLFQILQYDMKFSGPIVKKKASFFFNFGRIETDDNELVRATILDDNLNPTDFGQAFLVPRRNLFMSPRFDYAINTNNTLVVRYNYNRFSVENFGVQGFNLPERGYDTLAINQNVQVTETAILNPTTINETRFQFTHNRNEQTGSNSIPALDVSGSFGSGGSQVGESFSVRKSWELSNFTAKQHGTHAIKFGGRVRHIDVDDTNEGNFGGTWTFTGGFGLSSIERYQKTLQLQEQGFTPAEIRALGGGASQFRLNPGDPFANVSQTDYGVFIQDDWRIKPNLTLSYGLRYEIQTNAHSKLDFAPRIAVAWSPGAANSAKPPKMVIDRKSVV